MAVDVTGRKSRQVFGHIEALSEQTIRAITLRSHHATVSDRTVQALKFLSELETLKSPAALLDAMQGFQGAFHPEPDDASNGGVPPDDDFRYLEGLYLIKASAMSQIFFIDLLAQLYTSTQHYLDYWKYEEENPVHYVVTNLFWRAKQLHFLVTNEAATGSRRRPQTPVHLYTPLSPPARWPPPSLLGRIVQRIREVRPWNVPWRLYLTKWTQALSRPLQFQYLLRQCFSDIVRGNIRLLSEVQRQVVEQLGHTHYLLANLTTPPTEKALGNVTRTSLLNIHEYLLSAQLALGVVASQPTTADLARAETMRRDHRAMSLHEDLALTPKEDEQDTGLPVLITIVQQILDYQQAVLDAFEKVRPSTSRFWVHWLLGLWLTYRGVTWARHTPVTVAYVWDVIAANFRTYFLDPVQEILNTVFRSQALQLHLGDATAAAEMQALENMVLQYHRDRGATISEAEATRIRRELEHGDLGSLNRDYEACVQRPITSSLFGDMARLLLIQMQLQKVNITQLYVTMDDVMRKNELNFNVMATMPACMLIIFGVHAYLSTRRFRTIPVYQQVRGGLRDAAVRFNRASGPSLHWLDQGYLLLEVAKMKALAGRFPDREMQRWFLEDLEEIEDASLTCQQRLNTVDRMHRIYGFLRNEGK